MNKRGWRSNDVVASKRVERREALRGLGALAVLASPLASACGSNESSSSGTGGGQMGGFRSTGGSMATGGGGMQTGGAMTGGGGPVGVTDGAPNPNDVTQGGNGADQADGQTDGQVDGQLDGQVDAQIDASRGDLVVPPWDAVPTCMLVSATDGAGQGPFFIHEKEKSDDISLYRQDIRGRYNTTAAPGVEMQLHLRVLSRASMDCGRPIVVPNVEIYIWHTDGQGFYSGFGTRGGADEQKPDDPYMGVPSTTNLDTSERFCRGIQTTNSDGVASFRSIFPGWYNGRVLHIHFVAFKPGSNSVGRNVYSKQNEPDWLFTTQLYVDKAFAESVHGQYDPYRARTRLSAYDRAMSSGKMGTEPNSSGLIVKASLASDIVTAQMQIVLDPS